MANFTPKTDEQFAEERMWPEGEYDFTVSAGYDRTSKSGNDMIELVLRVYNDNGNFQLINDYLVFSEKSLFKVSQASKCMGLKSEYDAGSLDAEMFVEKSGRLKLGQDQNEGYLPKNTVRGYIVPKDGVVQQSVKLVSKPVNNMIDDDIPF